MSDSLEIQSHKGSYHVLFSDHLPFDDDVLANSHFIIDKKVAALYQQPLKKMLSSSSVLLIEALEKNKSLEQLPLYVEHLIKNKLRRNQRLIAIGGGIIQDITCFLAATLLRGIEWWYVPTTLLAQADSCIGSKSSINCGQLKNILGTFTPPHKVFIDVNFLKTLDRVDIRSGIGEMLKVHAIHGEAAFHVIAGHYSSLFDDPSLMTQYIRRSLEIKKVIIEQDEFDLNLRQVMNYGHTFGHAIESATDYHIPHGIAVTIGMDMANYIAVHTGHTLEYHYQRMHPILKMNYTDYLEQEITLDKFMQAITKDKKNMNNKITLILPDQDGKPSRVFHDNDQLFHHLCASYLQEGRAL